MERLASSSIANAERKSAAGRFRPAGIFFVEVEKRLGEFFPRLTPAAAFGVALEELHILLGLLVLLFKGGSRVRVGNRGHEQGEGKGDQKGSEQTPDGGG